MKMVRYMALDIACIVGRKEVEQARMLVMVPVCPAVFAPQGDNL